jgi:hypothetical protein
MENRYCYAALSVTEQIFIMNTCICFISRFTCFTLLAVHFLREPQYCFYANRFGGGYIVSFRHRCQFRVTLTEYILERTYNGSFALDDHSALAPPLSSTLYNLGERTGHESLLR